MRYPLVCVLALALGVVGCNETSGKDGSGGAAGAGGTAGMGGSAGASGNGGTAGAGGDPVPCQPTTDRCTNGPIEPHEPCCEHVMPDQANACDGTESTDNPATCTPGEENPITYRLTFMEVEGDCNVGYDLDGCDGESCVRNGITPADGVRGVDNALAGFGPVAAGIGGDLGALNQAFSDALCGLTEGGICEGGDNDGELCKGDHHCGGAGARCEWGDCRVETSPVEIRFVIDANAGERCANVTVLADGEPSSHILNLSDDGCLSGRLGTIRMPFVGDQASFGNTVLRMTVSPTGFSHGLLGATIDGNLVWVIMNVLIGGAWDGTAVPMDINTSTPPTIDAAAACNGLSATLRIGGIAEAQRSQPVPG